MKGISPWPRMPASPKLMRPTTSSLKHMEKLSDATRPLAVSMPATDTFSLPSPIRPLKAPPSRKEPVGPHLNTTGTCRPLPRRPGAPR
ncbi:hypothetical protein BDA96_01G332000 [Sorghum bicolor]|uniref:Uncharacterized protein n=2 Tax=Sorghum bicolor TaxID=4558 RepID=A0A921S1E6_SORBI|nr:hypothetical protein BDA96_01G332000 [Sorghum bicolor]OQU92203.1 hypothetical protein SORBI_3001G309732 [Sorghum bicolor]